MLNVSENLDLYHDRGSSTAGFGTTNEGAIVFNPWQYITKGTSVSQRIGDEVYARGMSVRLFYLAAADRPSQFVRIVIAVIPKTVGTTIMDGSNFDLLDAAGSNDTVTGMIKKEGVKVLYDKVTTLQVSGPRAVATLGESRMFKKFFIKSKRGGVLKWQQDGNLANKPVGVWVIPYDSYSTLRTDILGKVSFTYKLYFKDA